MHHFALIAASLWALLAAAAAPAQETETPASAAGPAPTILLPKASLGPADLALIVNDADPLSKKIGEYYRLMREIPQENVVHVSFEPGHAVMARTEFEAIKARVDAGVPPRVQALALTWALPYRVGCMSITTAFAAGFDEAYCAEGCQPTKKNPYYLSKTIRPYQDTGLRPTMSLAALSFEEARNLIDRGVASDGTWPGGTGYLVDTSDKNRNVRALIYEQLVAKLGKVVGLKHVKADYIENRDDVLFYFTGATTVPQLQSNTFVPGAIADHLTSAGGVLDGTRQMSSLRWLEAGATGSYGAVVEPCNYPHKFPDPALVIQRYTQGSSLVEAYWSSVAMPGQGIFLGDPLASPYGGAKVINGAGGLELITYALPPGIYSLWAADYYPGPFTSLHTAVRVGAGRKRIRIPSVSYRYYRLVPATVRAST